MSTIPGNLQDYLALVTSEHNQMPRFMATLQAVLEPLCANIALQGSLFHYYDLDEAVGVQLDAVGEWVGRDRNLRVPITAYFSFGIAGLGWGEGVWKGPFDPDTGLIQLPDDLYRALLRATIIANQWNGTIDQAYEAWDILMSFSGSQVLIQDFERLQMAVALIGSAAPSELTRALFTDSSLKFKPAGVTQYYYLPTIYPAGPGGTPLFGFGVQNETIAGWGSGAWVARIKTE